jgi:hypothetical protein
MPNQNDSAHSLPRIDPSVISGITQPPPGPEGIDLDQLAVGAVVELQTGHTRYRLENLGDGKVLISGHPEYCPQPTPVELHGSVGADGALKWHRFEPGGRLVFNLPQHGLVRTSRIQSLHRLQAAN